MNGALERIPAEILFWTLPGVFTETLLGIIFDIPPVLWIGHKKKDFVLQTEEIWF